MSPYSKAALAIVFIFFSIGIFGPLIATFGLFEKKELRIINQKSHEINVIQQ